MKQAIAALAVAASLGLACLVPPASAAAVDGRAVAAGADCAACHVVPAVAAPPRTGSCTGCHEWVRTVAGNPGQRARAMQIFPKWERYEANVKSYFAVPDLAATFARVEPAWIRRYLADPWDLRPAMDESMVRLGLSAADLSAIADWAGTLAFSPPKSATPTVASLPEGERLFSAKGCVGCHAFGTRSPGPGIAEAPDLRWARDRMSDDMIAAWIQAPSTVSPAATMPTLGLTSDEVRAVRDYVVLAPPDPVPPTLPAPAPTVQAQPAQPRWDDVESRVFGKICLHCHMDPAQNEGRAGPGNAGGFGWPATGIELQTYEGVVANRSRILAALDRRAQEEARDHVSGGQVPSAAKRPEKPGMPLGQPALPAADLALVRAWFEAGAPP